MIEEALMVSKASLHSARQQAVDLNRQGKYVEGHRSMQQAFWLLEEKLAS